MHAKFLHALHISYVGATLD